MPVDPEELLREEAEEEGREVFIEESIFCERCGYNLMKLPPVGRCPECGASYNARRKKGIFVPELVAFPAFDLAASVASVLVALWLLSGLASRFDVWVLLFVFLFAALAVIFVKQTWAGVRKFLRAQKLLRRIAEEIDDS
jgi:hypothetical protein